jgi:hypothetical protein
MQMKLMRIANVDFDVADQRLIKSSESGRYWRKKWEYNGTVHELSIVFNKVLYSIFIDFGIPRKLAGLLKMCLNETYSTVRTGRALTSFLIRMA